MSKNDPAFPYWSNVQQFNDEFGKYEDLWVAQDGLTKLEWFAGQALKALKVEPYSDAAMAIAAVNLAEAVIAELERRSK
jgi:hypothetical protein